MLTEPSTSEAARKTLRQTQATDSFYQSRGKRIFDFLLGSLLLIAFSPILAIAWLAVRLTSPGPAIFSQHRVGLHGELFVMHKFRSMYIDQEHRVDIDAIKEGEKQGILHKVENDPRITPVGRFLRKTSIDELVQIWNVVRGDMSLVGPRPLVPHMLEPYPEIREKRSRVRPGITGLWQIYARTDNISVLGMVEHDLEYIDKCSLLTDLYILMKTPFAVLGMKGAQ